MKDLPPRSPWGYLRGLLKWLGTVLARMAVNKVCDWGTSAAEEERIVVDVIDRFVEDEAVVADEVVAADEVVGYSGVK